MQNDCWELLEKFNSDEKLWDYCNGFGRFPEISMPLFVQWGKVRKLDIISEDSYISPLLLLFHFFYYFCVYSWGLLRSRPFQQWASCSVKINPSEPLITCQPQKQYMKTLPSITWKYRKIGHKVGYQIDQAKKKSIMSSCHTESNIRIIWIQIVANHVYIAIIYIAVEFAEGRPSALNSSGLSNLFQHFMFPQHNTVNLSHL